ncbi:hypothetical protein [Allosalinactinospora lopnorensis]|uniref:hypothetical protein n=1 Tax=Allosalinactinospora lopnorensis TaxID=1352348 RepID=UPI0012E1700D|nr:hypothetical protein [Allosalinactinospora lopnorensis]
MGLAVFALIVTAVVALSVRVRLRNQRQRDLVLFRHWEQVQEWRGATSGAELIQVYRVYQEARSGTKAIILWLETGHQQDAWFRGNWPEPGSVALVHGSTGWGPHNRNPDVFYIEPHQIVAMLSPDALAAVERHQRRQLKRAG